MSVKLESLAVINPNPNASHGSRPWKMAPMVASLRFAPLLRPRGYRVSVVAKGVSPKGLGVRFLSMGRRSSWNPSIVASAASHEESVRAKFDIFFYEFLLVCKWNFSFSSVVWLLILVLDYELENWILAFFIWRMFTCFGGIEIGPFWWEKLSR